MDSRVFAYQLIISIVLIIVFAGVSMANDQIMPRELMLHAKEKNCQPVYGFYDRPGMIEPPYLYGYLEGYKEDSAVYWCQNSASGNIEYFLNIVSKNNIKSNGCSSSIRWDNYPGGLSVVRDSGGTIDNFIYLENSKKHPIKGIAIDESLIQSEYDGVITYFYCYKDSWLIRQLH